MVTQHMVTQTMPQGIYRAPSWLHSTRDGAESADRSLTACDIQSYPGQARGEKATAAVWDNRLTSPSQPSLRDNFSFMFGTSKILLTPLYRRGQISNTDPAAAVFHQFQQIVFLGRPVDFSTPEETPSHRLGTYYLETGYGVRPSKVTYDRKHSAITEYDFSKIDVDALLEGFDWLHLSGITPALSKSCADFILKLMRTAKEKGLTVSFDGNFRSLLWSWEEARDYCTLCLPYIDVLFGIEPYHLWKDEADHSKGDKKDGLPMNPSYEAQDEVFGAFVARYPNLKCIARHVRTAHSGSENSLKAFMWYDGHTFESKLFTFNILDRVGGGDAFASGLIYAYMNGYKPMDMINFAVASSVIKHTIHGDGNITDDVDSIRNLMNMNYDIKR